MKGKLKIFIQPGVYFFCLVLLFFNTIANGQEINKYAISVRTHYGFVMVHRPYMAVFNNHHVPSVELSFARRLTGQHQWEADYQYPEIGISVNVLDLGNRELLGTGVGACWFYNLPLIRSEKLQYSLKVGQGFGWIQKKFDVESNYKNFANSTAINGFVYFNNLFSFPITDQLRPSIGLSFVHFSNGAYQKPNLGLNIPSVNFGFDYYIGKSKINQNPAPDVPKDPKRLYFVSLTGAKKERKPAKNGRYPVIVLKASTYKSNNHKSYWGIGMDFFYESSNKYDLIDYEHIESPTFFETMQTGIHLGYLLKVGKVYYVVQQGFYAHNKYKDDGIMYHRIGAQYQLTERLRLNTLLKTHFAVADHLEFGFTYQIK